MIGFILGVSVALYQQLTVYQQQGGNRQTIQLTERNSIAPQRATVSVQGNQEDADTLQPALGYNSLTWKAR